MKVLVLGAGVIGVTSAYYLARAGHDVTVVERNLAAAEDTSFANSGQISPGYSAPWAGPGLPLTALKWILTDRHSPLIVRPTADGARHGECDNEPQHAHVRRATSAHPAMAIQVRPLRQMRTAAARWSRRTPLLAFERDGPS